MSGVGGTPHDSPHDSPLSLAEFADRLGRAKRASRWSYQALGAELDRPRSTLHGWITGTHLPYPRDLADFTRLLALLGVDDAPVLLRAVAALRADRGTAAKRNPYRGLEAFTADDTELFFGRDTDTHALVEQVRQRITAEGPAPPLVIVGRSGIGKSSLLQAGLQARLTEAASGVDGEVVYLAAADLATAPDPRSAQAVVIVDQFEYLLHAEDPQELTAGVERLGAWTAGGAVVVVAVRADEFERASAVDYLMTGMRAGPFVLGAMAPEQITTCITAPAERAGRTVEPALLSQLLIDFRLHSESLVASSPLPLLSHILYRLAADGPQQLTLADYRSIGGLEGALERSAEAAYVELESAQPGATRAVLLRMVELGDGGQPTRRPVRLSALRDAMAGIDVDSVIAAFTTRRLVMVDIDTATISHEAMIGAWPRLDGWIDETRASLATARKVRNARRVWDESQRDPSMLLSGQPLDDALQVGDDPIAALHLDADDEQFLALSRDRALLRSAEVEANRSRGLAARAALLPESERSIAARMAAEAYAISPTVDARSAVISAVSAALGPRIESAPGVTTLARFDGGLAHSSPHPACGAVTFYRSVDRGLRPTHEVPSPVDGVIMSFAVTPDGQTLLLGTNLGRAAVVDVGSGRSVELTTALRSVAAVALSTDGRVAVVGGDGDDVSIWRRTDDGSWHPGPTIAATSATMALALAADRLAVASYDGEVALFDLAGRRLWRNADAAGDPASTVALGSDGRLLVVGHHGGDIRTFDLTDPASPVELAQTTGRAASWINSISFSPSGDLVAIGASDGQVRFWQVDGWQALERRLRHPAVVSSVVLFGRSGLATTGEDGVLRVWHDHQAQALDVPPTWSITTDGTGSHAVSVDRTAATSWTLEATGDLFGRPVFRSAQPDDVLAGSGALSGDGSHLYLGTRRGSVLCVDQATGAITARLDQPSELIEQLATAGAAEVVAAAVRDGSCPVWRGAASAARLVGTIEVAAPALGVAVDRAGRFVAITSGLGEIALAVVDSDAVRVVDRHRPDDSGGTLCAAFHPTLALLATGSVHRTATIWRHDDTHLQMAQVLSGPTGNVMGVAFSPSGHRFAAGATDGSIWIWRTSTAFQGGTAFELETVITTGNLGVYALVFTSDDVLHSAGPAERPQRWDLDVDRVLSTLDAIDAAGVRLSEVVRPSVR